ncbi:hypothetical protein BD779DRAFT_1466330 [Infundibulicybe gibba]|nr:hypothetical protein BD779DRAFT_1466330 [Infundibulicybe gibba]
MSAYFKNDKNYQTRRSKAPAPQVASPLHTLLSKSEIPPPAVPGGAARPGNRPEPQNEYGRPGEITPTTVQKLFLDSRFEQNQKVEVHIEARGWVVGVIVATLQFIDALSGWGYQVRYRMSETGPEVVTPVPAHTAVICLCIQDITAPWQYGITGRGMDSAGSASSPRQLPVP